MAENTNSTNVDEIVNKVADTIESGELSSDGIIVEFEDGDGSINIVFEDEESETAEEEKAEAVPAARAEALAEPSEKIEEKPVTEEPEEEITIPLVQEDNSDEITVGDGIVTTYVPRFTEVSDNYRMRSSQEAFEEKKEVLAPTKKSEFSPPVVLAEAEPEASVNPTAETLDSRSSISDATVVSSGNSVFTGSDEVTTVFKFEDREPLAFASPEPIPEPAEQPESEPSSEEPEEEPVMETSIEEPEEKKPYVMPDPDSVEAKVDLPMARPTVALEIPDEQVRKKRKRSEYTSFSEKDGFLDGFVDSIMSLRVRIVAIAVLAALLLFAENASFIGIEIAGIFNIAGIGAIMALITFPIVVGVFLLLLPEVIYSFVALTRRKLVPEFFLTVLFGAITVCYVLLVAFERGEGYSLFGFIYAIFALAALISSYYKKKADFAAFKVVSHNGEKQVVDRKLTRNLPAEHRALDGKIESYKSRTARVFRTSFVSDFSARCSIISENTRGNIIILSASLGISLVSAIAAYFIVGTIVSAALTFTMVLMLALPVFTTLSHKLPFYQATLEALEEKSALVGEASFFDYAGVDVVTFDDTEIFGRDDVVLQRIKVYGRQENFQKALQEMCALFTVVGGPLKYIFENSLDRRVSPADNVAVDADGVIGRIDGAEVMAGSEEFMLGRGIEIPYDATSNSSVSKNTRIMYAAENGEIYAKFYVNYRLSEEFTMVLPLLIDEGIKPLVYTRDPNVNDSLFRSLTAGTDSIRTLKKQNLPENERRLYQRISLGMVSVGDKTNIINTLLLTKKYASLSAKLAISELPAMIGGALIGLFLAICGPASVSSLLLSLWHIAWCAAIFFIGKKTFAVNKEAEDEPPVEQTEEEKDENSEE